MEDKELIELLLELNESLNSLEEIKFEEKERERKERFYALDIYLIPYIILAVIWILIMIFG